MRGFWGRLTAGTERDTTTNLDRKYHAEIAASPKVPLNFDCYDFAFYHGKISFYCSHGPSFMLHNILQFFKMFLEVALRRSVRQFSVSYWQFCHRFCLTYHLVLSIFQEIVMDNYFSRIKTKSNSAAVSEGAFKSRLPNTIPVR